MKIFVNKSIQIGFRVFLFFVSYHIFMYRYDSNCIAIYNISLYLFSLYKILLYFIALYIILGYFLVLYGIVWYRMILYGIVWSCFCICLFLYCEHSTIC